MMRDFKLLSIAIFLTSLTQAVASDDCLSRAVAALGGLATQTEVPDGAYILDTNALLAIAYIRDQHPKATQETSQYLYKKLQAKLGLSADQLEGRGGLQDRIWRTPTVTREFVHLTRQTLPEGIRSVQTMEDPGGPNFKWIYFILEKAQVGGPDGLHDRKIVTEAFLAKTAPGAMATFATADRGILRALCQLTPSCRKYAYTREFEKFEEDGFVVRIRDRAGQIRQIRVMPLIPL